MTSPIDRLISLAMLPAASIPDTARDMARLSLFDWITVGIAGRREPLSRIVTRMVTEEGGIPVATVFGGTKLPARAAALANGTISHALDYDDTHFAHVGHLSVGILPAAMAAAEEADAETGTMLDAFLVGAEIAIRLGMTLGREHYQRGFHQTATAGAFGAAVAAGRVMGLDAPEMRHAVNLVASRASGLKSQFGTMGKPFNAGLAASNGVEAARLAASGFMSCDDGVFGAQGFVETHSEAPDMEGPWRVPPAERFLFEDIKYKLHACCHGTHAMIEGLRAALREGPVDPERIAGVRVAVNPRWLKVCDLKAPRSGLEIKFSYAWLAGMVLHGVDTAAEQTYTDALASDRHLAAMAQRVRVTGDDALADTETRGEIRIADDRRIPIAFDLSARVPAADLGARLRAKSEGLIGVAASQAVWTATVAAPEARATVLGQCLGLGAHR